jgi:phospholipase C
MAKPGYTRGHRLAALVAGTVAALIIAIAAGPAAGAASRHRTPHDATFWPSPGRLVTATPIKHLVVIFQENVSFDKYFATYPYALNPPGEPRFVAAPGTPSVNGLGPALLSHNPNLANPTRLEPDTGNACGSNHNYLNEQEAFDHGLMDRFVEFTGPTDPGCPATRTLDYYDGNTVTAMWNYAQHFSLSDNSFGTTFGPSHIGAINLISGNNHGAVASQPTSKIIDGTQVGNVEPTYDDCPVDPVNIHYDNKNIGDLLDAAHVTWGWFSDGFKPTSRLADGTPVCDETRTSKFGVTDTVYDSGNSPFQYYKSTSNQLHLRPSSVQAIGNQDQANHEYDTVDFWAAARADNLPAVSFIKAGGYQQGGGSDSDPLDEQEFLTTTINRLERLPSWHNTAVVIMYDDSDGGYDHVMGPIVNDSQTSQDALTGPGQCGTKAPILGGYQGRCGYGPRLPLLVISPWARVNHVDNTLTDQTSIIHFVEDNWLDGERIGDGSYDELSGPLTGMFNFASRTPRAPDLFLDPSTGEPITAHAAVRRRRAGARRR